MYSPEVYQLLDVLKPYVAADLQGAAEMISRCRANNPQVTVAQICGWVEALIRRPGQDGFRGKQEQELLYDVLWKRSIEQFSMVTGVGDFRGVGRAGRFRGDLRIVAEQRLHISRQFIETLPLNHRNHGIRLAFVAGFGGIYARFPFLHPSCTSLAPA